jgi:hypothetical protein
MDFGGDWHLHIYAIIIFIFFPFSLSKGVEKGPQAKTKPRGKKLTMASIHLFVHLVISN